MIIYVKPRVLPRSVAQVRKAIAMCSFLYITVNKMDSIYVQRSITKLGTHHSLACWLYVHGRDLLVSDSLPEVLLLSLAVAERDWRFGERLSVCGSLEFIDVAGNIKCNCDLFQIRQLYFSFFADFSSTI